MAGAFGIVMIKSGESGIGVLWQSVRDLNRFGEHIPVFIKSYLMVPQGEGAAFRIFPALPA